MKKLLKSEVCESHKQCMGPTDLLKEWEKSNFTATIHKQCINNSRKSHKRVQKKKKKKKKTPDTDTLGFSAQSKRSFAEFFDASLTCVYSW